MVLAPHGMQQAGGASTPAGFHTRTCDAFLVASGDDQKPEKELKKLHNLLVKNINKSFSRFRKGVQRILSL